MAKSSFQKAQGGRAFAPGARPGRIILAPWGRVRHPRLRRWLCWPLRPWGCGGERLSFPQSWTYPFTVQGEAFLVYKAHGVFGFGHLGLVVRSGGEYLRYDQFSSSELTLERLRFAGTVGPWDPLLCRLRAMTWFTREQVLRRGPAPLEKLVWPWEVLLPLELPPQPQAALAQALAARWQSARHNEQPQARRYSLWSNNCLHFVKHTLAEGGVRVRGRFPKRLAARWETHLSSLSSSPRGNP
ncbi:MAG: hypothetical protein OEV94_12205 [Deltaproteobacteria bacterium]|nr:hypothetical protein [Deltaproteobacteria bacterium]